MRVLEVLPERSISGAVGRLALCQPDVRCSDLGYLSVKVSHAILKIKIAHVLFFLFLFPFHARPLGRFSLASPSVGLGAALTSLIELTRLYCQSSPLRFRRSETL